ncbi:MAG: carbohydrate-binding protein [Cyanobacteria bacterium P01_F01_bin.143]
MAIFTVTNNNDSGSGSLRQAIADANVAIGLDTIEFDNSLSGQEITLTSGELQITDDLNINGLGADFLTISGNSASRVFVIDDEDETNILNRINITIDGLTITESSDVGIFTQENLTVTNSVIFNNAGTGIFSSFANLTVATSIISGNTGNFAGGISIIQGGFLRLTDSTISNNIGRGIIAGRAGYLIENSTISGNTTTGSGGGISGDQAVGTVINSTITNNIADSDGDGIGDGGGVANPGTHSIQFENTIIAGNFDNSPAGETINPDVFQPTLGIRSNGYNLIGDITGVDTDVFAETGDLFGSSSSPLDPLLGPLQDNGGFTPTHALLNGSPAIDVGNPNLFELLTPFDQRSVIFFPRVLDGDGDSNATVDIGAFEFANLIEGTPGDDSLNGTAVSDRIFGDDGNDTLRGRGSFDILLGEAGDDSLLGGNGDDILNGGIGADILFGQGDHDYLVGDDGNDTLNGGAGDDQLFGEADDDRLVGNNGDDILDGGIGADILFGQGDNDYLVGGDGNDTLNGGTGDDQLFGEAGDDRLIGGDGDDTLNGGLGRDLLFGGAGSDRFLLVSGVTGDRDIIRDYEDGLDRLVLTGDLSFNDLTIVQSNANTQIRETATNQILAVINNIDASNIDQHDFEFGGIRVEAEDYVDFSDTTVGNTGGVYRSDDVDIEDTTDIGGGFNIGYIAEGEWLTYNVNLAESGLYQVVARVASNTTDGRIHHLDVSLDGQTTSLDFEATGGWQSWTDVIGDNLNLSAGSHELRFDMGSAGFNINYVDLIPLDEIRIQAEDYLTYFDTTPGNTGGEYRNDDVDIEVTTDIGGGFNVGYIEEGESLTYDVDIPESGLYQVVARVASNTTDGRVHRLNVVIGGESTSVGFDATGGWQSWTNVIGDNLNLDAGSYELRLNMGSSEFNVNYVDLIPVDL